MLLSVLVLCCLDLLKATVEIWWAAGMACRKKVSLIVLSESYAGEMEEIKRKEVLFAFAGFFLRLNNCQQTGKDDYRTPLQESVELFKVKKFRNQDPAIL